jgi:GR25 family glycosyltransferase involved in LPS biosynthesis
LATRPIPFRRLTDPEIAATISHIEAYCRLVASGKEWALILEDDAVFEDDFSSRFDAYFASIPDDADLVFLGGILRLQLVNADPNQHFHRKDHPATNCVDSYVVRSSAAQAIFETIVPFALPIDWELNYQLKLHDLTVYWVEPPLVVQGSEVGLHHSSIR